MGSRAFWRRARAPAEYGLIRLAMGAVSRLSFASLAPWARKLGRVALCFPKPRRTIYANLTVAFPDWPASQRAQVAREVAANVCLTFMEFLWFGSHPEELRTRVSFEGEDAQRIADVASSGGGSILLAPHLGNWELLGQRISAAGIRISGVARRIRHAKVEELGRRIRTYHGTGFIEEAGAARGILRTLRNGEMVGILMDQNVRPRRGGIFVDFFGLPAPTSRAPAAFARRLGAHVVCAAVVREDGALRVRSLIPPRPAADYADDVEATQAFLQLNEKLIRQHPEQYMWDYSRWQYIPDDASTELRTKFPWYSKPLKARMSADG